MLHNVENGLRGTCHQDNEHGGCEDSLFDILIKER